MMNKTTLLVGALLFALTWIPAPALADGCGVGSEGSGACAFSCPEEINAVGVSASISSPFLQWRTIEGRAYCAGDLSAVCAGHGACEGEGGGVYGSGSCIFSTGMGVDFTGGCVANGADLSFLTEVTMSSGTATGESCGPTICWVVEVVCIYGTTDLACGVGVTEADLQVLFPNLT